jgi:hypothetical protein
MLPACGERRAHVAQDRGRALVVPVVNHVLEQDRVRTARDLLEEAASRDLAAVRDPEAGEVRARALRDVGLIEDDTAQPRVGLQDPAEEGAVSAADVHHCLELREVVRGGDRGRRLGSEGRHRPVEVRRGLRVLGHLHERVGAGRALLQRGQTRAHGELQLLPVVLDGWTREQSHARAHRAGHVRAQELAERSEREAAVVLLGEDPDARQQPQHAPQRLRQGLRRRGQLCRAARPAGHVVGDAELRGEIQRPREVVTDPDLIQRGARGKRSARRDVGHGGSSLG